MRVALLRGEDWGGADTAAGIAIAARRLGLETQTFENSDHVLDFVPDFVLALSAHDPKLSPFPTYGLVDEPPAYYERATRLMRNVCTYDAWLAPSTVGRQWLRDLAFGIRKHAPHIAFFGRTAQTTEFHSAIGLTSRLAVHSRPENPNQAVLSKLSLTRVAMLYGELSPSGSLDSQALYGAVPADGLALIDRFQAAGIGLSLGGSTGLEMPERELFQIIASGAAAICRRSAWAERAFGDTLCYVDADANPSVLTAHILDRVTWIKSHRVRAREMAHEAHSILQRHYSLERLLLNVLEMHQRVLVDKGYRPAPQEETAKPPSVSYIVRTGGGARPLSMLRRALDSLVAQNYPDLTVILVLYAPFPNLADILAHYPSLCHKVIEASGGMRSTVTLSGLLAVDTDLFGVLDDDDELHPNHVRMLVRTFARHDRRDLRGRIGVVYSASVEAWPEAQFEERGSEGLDDVWLPGRRRMRRIEHYRFYSSTAMSEHRFFMASNSWLARSELLDEDVLDDPFIDTVDDLYLETLFAQRTHFAFSCEVTAVHHFHHLGQSTFAGSSKHIPETRRIALRHWQRSFGVDRMYSAAGYGVGETPTDLSTWHSKNLLPFAVLGQGVEMRGDVAHFEKSIQPGFVVELPEMGLREAVYRLEVFIEFADLDDDAAGVLRLEVLSGRETRLIAGIEIVASSLRQGGRFQQLALPFTVTAELTGSPMKCRLWRLARFSLDVVHVSIAQGIDGRKRAMRQLGNVLGTNLLQRMSAIPEARTVGDILRYTSHAPTGIALHGPYVHLPRGSYLVAFYLEGLAFAADDVAALRIDVSCAGGSCILAEKDMDVVNLRLLGPIVRIDLPFEIAPGQVANDLEFRLWRQAMFAMDVVRIVVFSMRANEVSAV